MTPEELTALVARLDMRAKQPSSSSAWSADWENAAAALREQAREIERLKLLTDAFIAENNKMGAQVIEATIGVMLSLDQYNSLIQSKASADEYLGHLQQRNGECDSLRATLATQAAQIEALRHDAAETIEHWGGYASDYFKDKWDLKGDIKRFRDVADE